MNEASVGLRKPILIISNTSWYVFNFRQILISELLRKGYGVTVAAPPDRYSERLVELGCRYVPLPMDNQGTNPLADLLLLARIWRLLRAERPLCVLSFTTKPNIYTALAARTLGIVVATNIAGLGSVFVTDTWLTWLVSRLYRTALKGSFRVFFQNRDDLAYFLERRLIRKSAAVLLAGSGVDTRRFSPRLPDPARKTPFRFLLFGRLLFDKGVGEYVESARRLKPKYPHVEFVLMGFLCVPNPSAIGREHVDRWVAEGVIRFVEASDDVVPQIAEADCVVLPSYYREGTPRVLLEAASMGKPLIATDSAGCRDAVEQGVTGFLVEPRNAGDLARNMEKMLQLPEAERRAMGVRGREKMLREFDERIVIERYLQVLQEVEAAAGGARLAGVAPLS